MATDRRNAGRRAAPTLIATLACWTLVACAPRYAGNAPTDERQYDCDGGESFSATFSEGRVRIDVDGYSYDLEKRPASVGVRYGARRVAFAQDEDRAALIGAANGPYKGCIETNFRFEK